MAVILSSTEIAACATEVLDLVVPEIMHEAGPLARASLCHSTSIDVHVDRRHTLLRVGRIRSDKVAEELRAY